VNSINDFWPTQKGIDECIRTEAETIDEAVLLAVHEPGPLYVRGIGGVDEGERTEQDLLSALMVPADAGSAVITAITGPSGFGKSHMIRWLYAQLQRHSRRAELVIILVPKTASLREVVERILAPLEGQAFEQLRLELAKSIERLPIDAAAEHLATALALELRDRETEWIDQLRRGGNSADVKIRAQASAAQGLQALLRDGTMLDAWFGKTLKRIVKQVIEGGGEADIGPQRRFVPDDLLVPDDLDLKHTAAASLRYVTELQRDDPSKRVLAASILQEHALDAALRKIFQFSQALGQRTIEEIVGDIRVQLLVERKELVLLIEDFAALAGIQQPLMNLMIAESDHLGKRVRAPLRTALAVTDGFLPLRQTILSRAQREWIIPSDGRDERDVVRRLINVTGRYLNAARWGRDALVRQFLERNREGQMGLYDWVQPFTQDLSTDDDRKLEAFGTSEQRYPLFPFNQYAIEGMARKHLTTNGVFSFNPRSFINRVLRDTLLLRTNFEANTFPPDGFKDAVASDEARLEISQSPYAASVRRRLEATTVFWANNPPSLTQAPQVPRGVFDAFGLPWPFPEGSGVFVRPPTAAKTEGNPPPSPSPELPPPQEDAAAFIREELNEFARGQGLKQKTANLLRNLLSVAVTKRIDWTALRIKPRPVPARWIWLPGVEIGNPTTPPQIRLAEATFPLDARIVPALLGLIRWEKIGNWRFRHAEEDYARLSWLLDELEARAEDAILTACEGERAVVARVLFRQAMLFQTTGKRSAGKASIVDLTRPLPTPWAALEQDGPGERTAGGYVLKVVDRARASHPLLTELLFDSIGCSQGVTGQKLLGIDPGRVREALSSAETPDGWRALQAEVQDAAADLSEPAVIGVVTRLRQAIDAELPKVQENIGPDESLQKLVDAFRTTVNRASQLGAAPLNHRVSDLLGLADKLSATEYSSVTTALSKLKLPSEGEEIDAQLSQLGAIDLRALRVVTDGIAIIADVLKKVGDQVASEKKATGGADVAQTFTELLDLLGGAVVA
jgi:hypothetical protein